MRDVSVFNYYERSNTNEHCGMFLEALKTKFYFTFLPSNI